MQPATRRLAAILVADMVGFSRHMERDDAGTLARLREIRAGLIDPRISENGGRVVKTSGDGMLVEFASADAALRCAAGVQREMSRRNAPVAAGDRIEFRIGINLGDIIIDGDDIAGDGVNVAARLEALADPGGICVSGAVRDQVHGSLDVEFVDIGEQQVKNIARPIRMYGVDLGLAGTSPSAAAPGGAPQHASRVATTPPAPPPMSIGVLPLIAITDDARTVQHAQSITRDMTAMLTRAATILSVVPVSQAQARAARDDARAAVKGINVRYLAEGEIRQSNDATLIGMRMINGATGEQVWSESVSLRESADPAERWRVLHAMVWHLSRALISTELRRVVAQPVRDEFAIDYVLRALAFERTESDALEVAIEMGRLLDEALRRDPNFVPALVLRARKLIQQLDCDLEIDRGWLVRRTDELTRKAVRLNDTQPTTWVLRSIALMLMGQWNASLEAGAKSLALEPYSSGLTLHNAMLTIWSGRPADALVLAARALVLDPHVDTLSIVGEARLLLGEYQLAVESLEKARGAGLDELTIFLFLAAACAHLEDSNGAAAARDQVLRLVPGYTIASYKSRGYSKCPEYIRLVDAHLFSGMRKAGFAEE